MAVAHIEKYKNACREVRYNMRDALIISSLLFFNKYGMKANSCMILLNFRPNPLIYATYPPFFIRKKERF